MTKELNQKLINTWDWLNSYCLSRRDDPDLSAGDHAICIMQINDYTACRLAWGPEKTRTVLSELESIMSTFALEDTLIARYNDSTYIIVLHYLEDPSEVMNICMEIQESINEACLGGENPLTVSIGASKCCHDSNSGYECAVKHAMGALATAQSDNSGILIATGK